jgi:hypothetical protein
MKDIFPLLALTWLVTSTIFTVPAPHIAGHATAVREIIEGVIPY